MTLLILWLQSTEELWICEHDARGTDHDLDPLPKDKWQFTGLENANKK